MPDFTRITRKIRHNPGRMVRRATRWLYTSGPARRRQRGGNVVDRDRSTEILIVDVAPELLEPPVNALRISRDHERGVGLMAGQQAGHRLADERHAGTVVVQRPSREDRRVTGARSKALRSRDGTSNNSARCNTNSRLGTDRPVSTSLRWRVDTSASSAMSSWDNPRRRRRSFNRGPTGVDGHARSSSVLKRESRSSAPVCDTRLS